MKLNTRLYDQLNAEQRTQAAISAVSRKDTKELERLMRSCPQRIYRQPDIEFAKAVLDQIADKQSFLDLYWQAFEQADQADTSIISQLLNEIDGQTAGLPSEDTNQGETYDH